MIDFPTKKMFYFFIPVIAVLGIFLTLRSSGEKSRQVETLQVIADKTTGRVALPETDLNNNNVPDWKESLPVVSSLNQTSTSSYGTLTEEAAVNLLQDYLSIKKAGAINSTTIEGLASNFQEQYTPSLYPSLTTQDITIDPVSNKENLRVYGNAIARTRDVYSARFSEAEPTDPQMSDEWEIYQVAGNLYSEMFAELKSMAVPKAFLSLHVDLLNNYQQTFLALESLSRAESDPMRALQGLNLYISLQNEESVILTSFAKQFEESGILFEASEPGYIFRTL